MAFGVEHTANLLYLHSFEGLGNRSLLKLFEQNTCSNTIVEASERIILHKPQINKRLTLKESHQLAKKCHDTNITVMSINDEEYPTMLKRLYDPPAILYARGDLNVLTFPKVGVVGTRKYSNYGQKVTRKLSTELTIRGDAIVSGLALGIDAIAHQSCLDSGGKTIAVLGSGVDVPSPIQNSPLYNEIIHSGGLILSEQFPGSLPTSYSFPKRNRIIAGISDVLLVIEAGATSGALITAKEALELGIEVCAVPGEIDSYASLGTNRLIQNGAHLVLESDDIASLINTNNHSNKENSYNIIIEDEFEAKIFSLLTQGFLSIDEIVAHSGAQIGEVLRSLSMLEIRGFIQRNGDYFSVNI
ncbi:DNA-protecting protein DprA [candidate division WWE3 bacterium]|nr:DNA-protecting protein DprA [candidate division WWE3 bacterium]